VLYFEVIGDELSMLYFVQLNNVIVININSGCSNSK